jgi:hypothetical protein
MWATKSSKGISLKTLQLYALTFFFRLFAIVRKVGYVPLDKTGDFFYYLTEVLSLLSVVLAIYRIMGPMKSSYEKKYDKFGSLNAAYDLGVFYLVLPCFLLAVIFHS